MRHVLLAAVAVAALAFPGLGATATNTTHAAARARPLARPVHQMLGAIPPFIRTGTQPGQGMVLHRAKGPRPQSGSARAVDASGPTSESNLTFGGPDQTPPKALASLPRVMSSNTNYAIFWVPSGYRTAANYQSTIDQYFTDVAHDSGGSANVDSTDVQYWDTSNDTFGYYDSTYGGSAVDTQPYPSSQCAKSVAAINAQADTGNPFDSLGDYHIHVLGTTVCLSDTQVQAEVKRFADSRGWPHGPNTEFFVYTAHNVDSCFYADGRVPGGNLNNQCSYDYYCAYHSNFGTTPQTEYIYANMPWPNQTYSYPAAGGATVWKTSPCDAGEHPNGTGSETYGTDPNGPTDADAADEVINVTSHEHNESVTDPTGYGWWVDADVPFASYEDGDLCAWYWNSDGSDYAGQSTNGSAYTNVINGHDYFLQGEWSNADANANGYSGCKWGYTIQTPAYTGGTNTLVGPGGGAGAGSTLTLTAGSFTGTPVYEFVWERCSPGAVPALIRDRALAGAQARQFALGLGCKVVQDDFAPSTSTIDTYRVTAKDVGFDIFGAVYGDQGSGTPSGEFAGGDSTPTLVSVGGEPELTGGDDPHITPMTGLAPGTPLTLDVGAWSNSPRTLTVQWQRCSTPGDTTTCATFKTVKVLGHVGLVTTKYTLVAADSHSAVRALVSATNAAGTDNYDGVTDMTDEVFGYPTESGAPSWTGTPVVGTAETLNLGAWSNTVPIFGYSVTIERCPSSASDPTCEFVTTLTARSAATTALYMPTVNDDGQVLVAYVYAKNKNGTSNASDPAVSSTVVGEPVNTLAPAFETTTATHGQTLTLDTGAWTPVAAEYRITYYTCTSPTDHTTCTLWYQFHDVAAATDVTDALPNLGGAYYVLAYVQAINAAGYSLTGVWSSNSVDVTS